MEERKILIVEDEKSLSHEVEIFLTKQGYNCDVAFTGKSASEKIFVNAYDFVLLDNRDKQYDNLTIKQVKHLCDRHFGIGADGLMLLNHKEGYDFEMKYFNADGRESSMCGNGGRCLVKFAYHLGIHKSTYLFKNKRT